MNNSLKTNEVRVCNQCAEEKLLNEYYSQNKTKANGEKYTYHSPKCKECSISNTIQQRRANPERCWENTKRWNSTESGMKFRRDVSRRAREDGYYRGWQQKNKDKIKEYNLKRQNKEHTISAYEWIECKKYFEDSCSYCGLSEEEHLKEYGQQLHKEHVDHEGSNGIDNCVPSCKPCNGSKGTNPIEEWYSSGNPSYRKEREGKIYKWLTEDVFEIMDDN